VNCVALLFHNVRYYVLYLVGHPEPVSLPRSWHILTFLCCRAVKQSIKLVSVSQPSEHRKSNRLYIVLYSFYHSSLS